MSDKITSNLLIVSSIPRLYQRLFKGIADYAALGKRIIKEVKIAHAFRQLDQIRQLSNILTAIPIKEYQLIGQYYLIWCDYREARYETGALDKLIDQTQAYKTKSLSTRGTIEWYKGNNDAALYFYKEALKTYPTISEYIDLSKSLAVLKAQDGFNHAALKDMENLLPLIGHAEPMVYYGFLNSYAVELSEAGRLEEAKNISTFVCNSPLAPYYKEWLETYSEVDQKAYKSRSTMHVVLPRREPKKRIKKAKILQFPQPKREPFFRPSYGPPTREEVREGVNRATGLDPKQLLAMIIKLVMKDGVTEDQIFQIVSTYYDVIVNGVE